MTLHVKVCQQDHIAEAALLFVQSYRQQRQAVPVLPDLMADSDQVAGRLAQLVEVSQGIVAVENGRLRGYLAWYLVPNFRGAARLGAYVPEWGHAAVDEDKTVVYRALYQAAAAQWSAANCQVHAITLLAQDREAEQFWFWQGFGLAVVDAVRPMRPLETPPHTALHIRQAAPVDAAALTALDGEHWQHYTQPPILMTPRTGLDAAANAAFVSRPNNSIWLAYDGDQLAGFIRCDGYDFDGVAIVESEQTVTITGAYVRPAYRGQRVAAALLDAALRHYEVRGFTCCALNFESFNPEATAFWLNYFVPVCYSLLRVPES
ncbi:MAG TPA: GNAT family N-acetyltransferase [Chloroflexota bacterium]|nr:GNAT family N-acetyltransferase [Chloroflexota bacterium]